MLSKQKFLSNPFVVFIFIYGVPFLLALVFAEWSDRGYRTHLGWAVLSITYCYIFRFKPLVVMLSIAFIIFSLVDISYAMVFGGIFTRTSSIVGAVAQTNTQEAIEIFQSYFDPLVLVVLLVYMAASFFLLFKLVCEGLPKRKLYRGIALFFFIVLTAYLYRFIVVKHDYYKVIPGIAGAYPTYLDRREPLSVELKERELLSKNNAGKFVSALDAPQTYIFIIGESVSRKHMSLYGYQRDTNPHLKKRQDLIVLDNVISNFAQTIPSLCYALTSATTRDDISCNQALSIMDAANIAGFKTWWISNQLPFGGTYSAIAEQAEQTIFIGDVVRGKTGQQYDGHILPELEKALASDAKKKVIFIHLMGSHLRYDKRYPAEYDRFDSPPYFAYTDTLSDNQKYYINTYDNSIAYNDFVVNGVIERVKKSSRHEIAALNYISDHGEEVFDAIDFKGHQPDKVTKNSFDIPFIVWLSEGYHQHFPESVERLKANAHKPYTLDDYFHFSLALMNVASPLYIEENSLFSPLLKPNSRMVYGKDYDVDYVQRKGVGG